MRPRFVLLLFLAAAARPQAPKGTYPAFTSVPVIEDRELYGAFFNYHHGLITAMNAAVKANPQASAQLAAQMAKQLGVNPSELDAVNSNTEQVVKSYASIDADRAKYRATRPKAGDPSWAQMDAQYSLTRTHMTAEGVAQLFRSLTPQSWNGLHNYILGDFKKSAGRNAQ